MCLLFAIIKLNFQLKFVQCFDISSCNEIKIGILWFANFFFRFLFLPFNFRQWHSMATNERITYANVGRFWEITFKFDAIYIHGTRYFRQNDQKLPLTKRKTQFFPVILATKENWFSAVIGSFITRNRDTGWASRLSNIDLWFMLNLCITRPADWQAICKFTRHFISTKYNFK